jgi:hypothetical protein
MLFHKGADKFAKCVDTSWSYRKIKGGSDTIRCFVGDGRVELDKAQVEEFNIVNVTGFRTFQGHHPRGTLLFGIRIINTKRNLLVPGGDDPDMIDLCPTDLKIILARVFSPYYPGCLREACGDSHTGTGDACPSGVHLVTVNFHRFERLPANGTGSSPEIDRVSPEPGMDGHRASFHSTRCHGTSGPGTIHGIPLNGPPGMTLLENLGPSCRLVNHHQKSL